MADDLAVIVFGYQAHVGYSRFTQTVHEERFVEAIEGQLVDLAYSIKVMRLFRANACDVVDPIQKLKRYALILT